jgi:hypothetical protein
MNMLDFNGAGPQAPPWEDRVDRVREECRHRKQAVLQHLLPGGRMVGREYEIGDLNGNPGKSLKFNLDSDKWADFSTGDKGGDLISLWERCRGVSFQRTVEEMESFFSTGSHAVIHTPPAPRTATVEPLPVPTKTWNYLDPAGNVIATVSRYDTPGGKKEFRPWDCAARKWSHPATRPLYNMPGIATSRRVVIVEGEKCADALIALGICATTAMGGCNAPIGKTDWSPLAGKQIVIWPDNDAGGQKYAAELQVKFPQAVRLVIPAGKPEKWDAADAVAEGFDVRDYIRRSMPGGSFERGSYTDYSVARFTGTQAPPIQWLFTGSFRRGTMGLLAGAGGVGKSFLLLQMACMIASGASTVDNIFVPGRVGKVVCLFGEDDEETIHHRIEAVVTAWGRPAWSGIDLNPGLAVNDFVERINQNLFVMTGAGNDWRLLKKVGPNPEPTPAVESLLEFLGKIEGLELVIVDPLSRFFGAEENDNTAGTLFCEQLERIAMRTGAAVLCSHHVNKDSSKKDSDPLRAEALRGASAFANGARWVCVLATKPLRKGEADQGLLVGRVVKKNFGKPEKAFYLCRGEGGILREYVFPKGEQSDDEESLMTRIVNLLCQLEVEKKQVTLRRFCRNYADQLKTSQRHLEAIMDRAITDDIIGQIEGKDAMGRKVFYLSASLDGTA